MNINISSSVSDSNCSSTSLGMPVPVPCLPSLAEASSGKGRTTYANGGSNRENECRMYPGRANDDVSVKLKALLVK